VFTPESASERKELESCQGRADQFRGVRGSLTLRSGREVWGLGVGGGCVLGGWGGGMVGVFFLFVCLFWGLGGGGVWGPSSFSSDASSSVFFLKGSC